MDSEQFITDDYWQLINYNYDQIRHAELKASIIVSIYSIFFTVAYTFDILDEENVYSFSFSDPLIYFKIIILIPAIFFTVRSFVSCISCFLPRLKISVKPSPLFFGDVQKNWPSFKNYSSELIKVMDDDNEYKIHLSQMAFVTGTIADKKFLYVGNGIRNLVRSVVFFLIFFILVLV
tara:strand:- start:1455 stop:1985 length:531 start_codon:yes stop_codon:yes gene_type:complete